MNGLSSLDLMRRLVAEENKVGRTLDLHRWAAYIRDELDLERLVSVRAQPRKVLALDLDGTLWDGVIGDGDVTPVQAVVDACARLVEAGILIAVVSKNEEHQVMRALGLVNVAAYRVNWRDKALNIVALAGELRLGVSSFAFLDDSPQERDRVSSALPAVVVFDPARDLWLLDAMIPDSLTSEDARRAQMYAEERERELERATIPDEAEWLRSLEMHVTTRSATEADMPRVVQLFERTNQFNSHPGLRDHIPIEELMVGEARDRFGSYGIVGAVRSFGGCCARFTMSCRVIGKGVAETLMHAAGVALVGGIEHERNAPLRRWAAETDFPCSVPEWVTWEER